MEPAPAPIKMNGCLAMDFNVSRRGPSGVDPIFSILVVTTKGLLLLEMAFLIGKSGEFQTRTHAWAAILFSPC